MRYLNNKSENQKMRKAFNSNCMYARKKGNPDGEGGEGKRGQGKSSVRLEPAIARLLALQIIKPVVLFDVFVPIRIPKDELS